MQRPVEVVLEFPTRSIIIIIAIFVVIVISVLALLVNILSGPNNCFYFSFNALESGVAVHLG